MRYGALKGEALTRDLIRVLKDIYKLRKHLNSITFSLFPYLLSPIICYPNNSVHIIFMESVQDLKLGLSDTFLSIQIKDLLQHKNSQGK